MKLLMSVKWHLKRFLRNIFYSIRIIITPAIEIHGVKLILKSVWSYNVKDHMIRKDYETGEIKIIKKTLSKDDKVLEIGTGLGFLSIYCSKIVGQNNVISVEANPFLKQYHQVVFKLNKVFPTIIYNSIGNKEEETTFYIDKANFWSSSIIPFRGKKVEAIRVKNENINNLIKELKPTYLIVDVEGFEHALFKHIDDFLTIKKIQIETHPNIIGKEAISELENLITKNGFKIIPETSLLNQYYFEKIND